MRIAANRTVATLAVTTVSRVHRKDQQKSYLIDWTVALQLKESASPRLTPPASSVLPPFRYVCALPNQSSSTWSRIHTMRAY